MNDTVCPKCGHNALSVATRCPRCGQAFDTRYYQHASEGPRRRLLMPGLLIAGVAFMILVANAVWRLPGSAPDRPAYSGLPAPPPSPAPEPKPPATAPAGNRAPVLESPEPGAKTSSIGALRRYAGTWVNIRASRSPRAPVLRILRPGDVVEVDSLAQGWYRVVADQRTLGYVDRRLLNSSPQQPAP